MFVCLFGFLTSSSTTRLYRGRAPRQERLTILRAATHETELGDHNFCLSRSHYTDTDPTCRERAATAGIEPGTSSPGVARSKAGLERSRAQADRPNKRFMLIKEAKEKRKINIQPGGGDTNGFILFSLNFRNYSCPPPPPPPLAKKEKNNNKTKPKQNKKNQQKTNETDTKTTTTKQNKTKTK